MNKTNDLKKERIINFLRYIKKDNDVFAVEIINTQLDKGMELDLIFKKDANGFGYSLSAKKLSEDKYKIEFGCQAGPLAGDGGEWEVSFDGGDKVMVCSGGKTWIS